MKKLSFILLLFLIILVLASSALLRAPKKPLTQQAPPTPTPVSPFTNRQNINYTSVFYDPSTKDSVTKTLQTPSGYTKKGSLIIVSFPTDVTDRPSQVYEQNGTAKYVQIEITVDNTAFTDFLNNHPGISSFQMFDVRQAGSGFSWYIFPQNGIAFLANKNSGYAIQTLYFSPTTQDDFIKKTATLFNMSLSDPDSDATQENFQ